MACVARRRVEWRVVVDVQGWMTSGEFADLFALAQLAPGPNAMFVSLVGWKVAGLAGALVATGKVGAEVSAEQAKELAAICALNAIAALKSVLGDLDKVVRIVKVVGFVASDPSFTGQPGVVNGASELLGAAFGDAGVHARSAVGVAVLPLDAPVEVELVAEVAD